WHFPRAEDGGWAGEYPASSTGAIAQLETLRAQGAQFLLIPQPALWWLDHYAGLRRYLEHRYQTLARGEAACALYDLRRPLEVDDPGAHAWAQFEAVAAAARSRLGREPAVLDWNTGLELAREYS